MRAFVAMPVDSSVRKMVAELQKRVGYQPQVRWVPAENLHLTLKFLGYVNERHLPQITDACRLVADKFAPFDLQTSRFGAFPNWRSASVFWIGLNGSGIQALLEIQQQIETQLDEIVFPKEERRFRPHLTLGRVRREEKATDAARYLQDQQVPPISFTVKNLVLYQSILKPSGARYKIVESFSLRESPKTLP